VVSAGSARRREGEAGKEGEEEARMVEGMGRQSS